MNVRSCVLCNRLFKPRGYPYCPDCVTKIDEDYIKVRDYLYKVPTAGVQQVLEETDVDEKRLFYLIRSGRVTFAEGADTGLRCESCGKQISSGTICKECQEKLAKSLDSVRPAPKKEPPKKDDKKSGIRMHIDDRIKRD